MVKKPKFIAFYLPQFYPFPENNLWWGKGFTEWTNVTKATPLFSGHNQPHLPTDFGFYDLRERETRRDQIATAKKYGVHGFCYHYYWFSGKRLLDVPLDDMLADSEADMPFCLCWANENWTRRWDAAEQDVLMEQKYQPEDSLAFIKSLVPYFSDHRYIRFEGKPFLIVYRPQQIPDPRKTVSIWKDYCRENGIGEIHVCAALTHGNCSYEELGFDSGVEFPPHNLDGVPNIRDRLFFYEDFQGSVVEYGEVARSYLNRDYEERTVFRTVFPDWDNTPRTGNRAFIVLGASPEAYGDWLNRAMETTACSPVSGESFVFINAWNEWAEGCHLEPDRRHGSAYLESTAKVARGEFVGEGMFKYHIDWSQFAPEATLRKELANILRWRYERLKKTTVNRLKRIEPLRKAVRKIRGK